MTPEEKRSAPSLLRGLDTETLHYLFLLKQALQKEDRGAAAAVVKKLTPMLRGAPAGDLAKVRNHIKAMSAYATSIAEGKRKNEAILAATEAAPLSYSTIRNLVARRDHSLMAAIVHLKDDEQRKALLDAYFPTAK